LRAQAEALDQLALESVVGNCLRLEFGAAEITDALSLWTLPGTVRDCRPISGASPSYPRGTVVSLISFLDMSVIVGMVCSPNMGRAMGQTMTRTLNRLSTLKVQRAKDKGLLADGGGLYLRVADSGTKSWIFRFGEGGKLRDMGLGPAHTITLAEAREMATECRKLRLQGIDPIAQRNAQRATQKAAEATQMTFVECAERYMSAHEGAWSNVTHRAQWVSTLQTYVYPIIGPHAVAAIGTAAVMKCIEPIWMTRTETASRVRGRIEAVLDWAKARGYRDGDNPARWRGHLDHLLPARAKVQKQKHLAALPYSDVGAFMAKLREETGNQARVLEFIILTAVRLSEGLGATWNEIDLDKAIWTVPASRMKAGKEHRVPLSDAAVAVLKSMPRQGDLVFPGPNGMITKLAVLKVVKKLAGDVTTHGFRSSFRDWAAEQTAFPGELAEMALAHTVGSAVEAAYRRSDLFDKRRKLMDQWAGYCGQPPRNSGDVVRLRALGG
jgi:integrase